MPEAARLFQTERLVEIARELFAEAEPVSEQKATQLLPGFTAVNGTLLRACSKMARTLRVDLESQCLLRVLADSPHLTEVAALQAPFALRDQPI